MARYRTIKPDFWTSSQIIGLHPYTRLLFVGIWNFCDDAGRISFDPKAIKAKVLPGDDISSENVRGMLHELLNARLLGAYVNDGKEFLYVTGWHHQKIDKPQKPKCPGPNDPGSKPVPGPFADHSRPLIELVAEPSLPFPASFAERSSPESNSERRGEERSKSESFGVVSEFVAAHDHDTPPTAKSTSQEQLSRPDPRPEPEELAKTLQTEFIRQQRALEALIPPDVTWPIKAMETCAPMPELAKDFDFDTEILPVVQSLFARWNSVRKPFVPRTWGIVASDVRARLIAKRQDKTAGGTIPTKVEPLPAGAVDWPQVVALFAKGAGWHGPGPQPDAPGCAAPLDVLERHGYGQDEPETPRQRWMRLVAEFVNTETWEAYRKLMGPAPGEPGCKCPRDIAEAHGFEVVEVDELGRPKAKPRLVASTVGDPENWDEDASTGGPVVNGPAPNGSGGAPVRARFEVPLPAAVAAALNEEDEQ